MPLTIQKIPGDPQILYEEKPGSPRESMQGDTFKVSRTYKVDWDDRWRFMRSMLGDASLEFSLAAVGYPAAISRINPDTYKVQDSIGTASSWLFATSIDSVEPIGPALLTQEVPEYEACWITVGYEAPHYRVVEDSNAAILNPLNNLPDESKLLRNVSLFMQPVAEFLTLPFGAFRWVEWVQGSFPNYFPSTTDTGNYQPGAPIIGSQGRIVAAVEVQLTWHNTPAIPSVISNGNIQGTVNKAKFVYPDTGNGAPRLQAPPRTLLLTSCEVKPKRWFGDKYLFDIMYKFKYFNPNGDGSANHNTFLHYFQTNLGTPDYRYMTATGEHPDSVSGSLKRAAGAHLMVYDESDYALLFQPF